MLHSGHESLKYINGQQKQHSRHPKWVELLQTFDFVAKYKSGKINVIADALSRKYHLLTLLESKTIGFEMLKPLYAEDTDLKDIYAACLKDNTGHFHIDQGFLFKEIDYVYLKHL